MNPVDLATAFHEMLTIRVNPATKAPELNGQPNPLYSADAPKGRPYTLRELSERVRKTYWWVRDHEAIWYLPDNLKLSCIKAWQAGKRNVTRYCKLGLRYKAQVTGQPQETALDNPTATTDNVASSAAVVGTVATVATDATVPANVGTVTETKNQDAAEISLEPTQRRRVLSLKAVVQLFDATPLESRERLATLAEVMGLDLDEVILVCAL